MKQIRNESRRESEPEDDEGSAPLSNDKNKEQEVSRKNKGFFTNKERALIITVFTKNGVPSKKIFNASVDMAMAKNLEFKALYTRIVEAKGGRKAANNTLRKSLRCL